MKIGAYYFLFICIITSLFFNLSCTNSNDNKVHVDFLNCDLTMPKRLKQLNLDSLLITLSATHRDTLPFYTGLIKMKTINPSGRMVVFFDTDSSSCYLIAMESEHFPFNDDFRKSYFKVVIPKSEETYNKLGLEHKLLDTRDYQNGTIEYLKYTYEVNIIKYKLYNTTYMINIKDRTAFFNYVDKKNRDIDDILNLIN